MYRKTTLANGLRVVSASMPETRSVSVAFFVGAGSRYEKSEEAGVSHFIEHMMFKGTDRFATSKEISETIEGVGGYMNAGTERETTVYWVKVARHHFHLVVDLLANLLRHSKFRLRDWEKERKVILEELSATEDSPQQKVDFLIDELIWPDQALGRDIGGTKASVQSLNRDPALEYLAVQYVANNMVVTVAGDISHEEVVETVDRALGSMKSAEPRPWFPAIDGQDSPRVQIEHRKTEQAHLCLGIRGLSTVHPDRHALGLLNVILGEGMSSRLFLELREHSGLCYEVYSMVSHYLDSGSVTIYAGVDPKKIEGAVKGILYQLDQLRHSILAQEITKAKELSKGRLLLRMEDTRAVAGWIGIQELLLGRVKTVDEMLEQVDSVTAADLARVAENLFHPDKLSLAIIGPYSSEDRFLRLMKL